MLELSSKTVLGKVTQVRGGIKLWTEQYGISSACKVQKQIILSLFFFLHSAANQSKITQLPLKD